MTNFIDFPQQARLEVTLAKDPATGQALYMFAHIDGAGRFKIATHANVEAATSEAQAWMAERLDVRWDKPMRAWLVQRPERQERCNSRSATYERAYLKIVLKLSTYLAL